MKNILETLSVALSMFSAVPVSFVAWNEKNTRAMLLCFPIVGLLCGLCFSLLCGILSYFQFSNLFISICLTLFPIIFTGGLHLDGYCDTIDAISSHQTKEKQLEILSDPHVGAFSVLGLISYLSLFFAIVHELDKNTHLFPYFISIFVISRSMSGIFLVSLPSAKSSGLAYTFSNQSDKKLIQRGLYVLITICYLLLFFMNVQAAITFLFLHLAVMYFWYQKVFSFFQGVSGDLLGYFSTKMEFYLFLGLVFLQKGGIL